MFAFRQHLSLYVGCMLFLASGCTAAQRMPNQVSHIQEPIIIQGASQGAVWERVVDVIHAYKFQIARENRLDGVIESEYKTGANLLELWHEDSVGFRQRLESTLQSIRRKVIVNLTPVEGGQMVILRVIKEKEDLNGLAANSAGPATFQESTPLERDLNLVVGQTTPSGWIPLGRDALLEAEMNRRLRAHFGMPGR